MNYVILAVPAVFLAASLVFALRAVKKGRHVKQTLAVQFMAFLAVCILTFAGAAVQASAQALPAANTAATTTTTDTSSQAGLITMAAAIAVAGACVGSGIAVGSGAAAAIGATSENPKAFGKSLIFVALGEGIPVYGLLIAFMILGKLG